MCDFFQADSEKPEILGLKCKIRLRSHVDFKSDFSHFLIVRQRFNSSLFDLDPPMQLLLKFGFNLG